ncbi:MAG: apolipoprotein N-acyltransferase [Gammaproteobacteria bacterium]
MTNANLPAWVHRLSLIRSVLLRIPRPVYALVAGCGLVLAFAPFNLWVLALLCPSLLFWLLKQARSPLEAAWIGWLFGLGLWLAGMYWLYFSISSVGVSAWLSALITIGFAACMACFQLLTGWIFYLLLHYRMPAKAGNRLLGNWDSALLFAAVWLLIEWCRSWIATGLPWLQLGTTSISWWASGWLPVIGQSGVAAVLLAGGAMVVAGRTFAARLVMVAVLLCMALAGGVLKQIDWVRTERVLEVRVIQTNFDASYRWTTEGLQRVLSQSLALTSQGATLILWPETALPIRDSWPVAQQLEEYLNKTYSARGQSLVYGVLHDRQDRLNAPIYNALKVTGHEQEIYLKRRLVPFGEYTPEFLSSFFQLLNFPESSLSSGPQHQAVIQIDGIQIAPAVCYEVIYPDYAARLAEAGLGVTISNDAWFGESIGPWQHLQIAQVQAAESRRWLLRSVNGGIGGVINARGEMAHTLMPFQPDAISATVPVVQHATPASWLPAWFYAALSALFIALYLAAGHSGWPLRLRFMGQKVRD